MKRVQIAAQVAGLASAAMFGVGWLFAVRLFGRLGFSPEEVGVDFPYLVVRVGLIIATATGAVIFLIVVLGQEERASALVSGATVKTRRFLGLLAAATLLGAGTVVAAVIAAEPWHWTSVGVLGMGLTVVTLGVSLFLTVLIPIGLLRIVRFNALSHEIRLTDTLLQVIMVVVFAFGSVAVAYFAADQLADRVLSGREVSALGVNMPLVDFYRVEDHLDLIGHPERQAKPRPYLRCAVLVSLHDGAAFAVGVVPGDSKRVSVRLPLESFSIVRVSSTPGCGRP